MAITTRDDEAREAERIGLAALLFLTVDGDRLGRFLGDTGLYPAELKSAAATPEGLVAVLDHLLADESMLLVFAADQAIDPAAIAPARAVLAGGAGAAARGTDGRPGSGSGTSRKKSSKRWAGPGA